MKADPKTSAGARAERKAIRQYIRRSIKNGAFWPYSGDTILQWVLDRQKRYDRRPGGLGR